MIKKQIEIMPAVILILISVILSGCSNSSEPDVTKTNNTNQSSTASNNTNVLVIPSNNPTPIVNNNSTVIANQKSSPSVKEPTPQIGSGGGDMSLLSQVRVALGSDEELINAVIVEIKEGNATMTGKVSSEAQKIKAGQIVQNVQGIKSVKNNLSVSR